MASRGIAAAAAVLAGAFLLTGCVSAREVPAPISDATLQAYIEDRLDAAWLNTGLEGTVKRPEFDPATLVENFRTSNEESVFAQCITSAGLSSLYIEEKNGGPSFSIAEGDKGEPAMQLTLYSCLAANPSAFEARNMIMTQEELDFLYDYYQESVVPCLELSGYAVGEAPTREQFAAQANFLWIPYNAITPGLVQDPYGFGLSVDQVLELVDRCGDPFPGMPYGKQYGF